MAQDSNEDVDYTNLKEVEAIADDESEPPPKRTSLASTNTAIQDPEDDDKEDPPQTNQIEVTETKPQSKPDPVKATSRRNVSNRPPEKKGCNNNKVAICAPLEPNGRVRIPPQERLPIHVKTSVDKLRASLRPRPEAVPKTSLPSWKELALNKKLPRVPAPPGAIVFTRGAVAKPLLRNSHQFSLNDPFGLERVPTNEYNALHDVHAYNYFEKPEVRRLLVRQGLINCQNEVLCSQREFNQFRSYLGSLQNEELNSAISDTHQRWLTDREQVMRLLKYQSMESASGRDYNRWLKTKNSARKNKLKQIALIKRMEEKKDADEARAMRYETEKQRQLLNRKLLAQEKERIISERRRRRLDRENQNRNRLLTQITLKDAAVEQRVEEEKEFLRRAYNQFLLEWFDAKYHFQEEHNPQVAKTERNLESNLKRGASERQAKVERHRERLPEILEARKEKERYIWRLTKKYFYRWLNKVRDRKSRKPDALHQSLWDAVVILDGTLTYLRKESGYEKLDDFILNIIKLKAEIKIRLAEEEEAERRASEQQKERSKSKTSAVSDE